MFSRHASSSLRLPRAGVVQGLFRQLHPLLLLLACFGWSLAFDPVRALEPGFDRTHQSLTRILQRHLTNGLVDYAALKFDPAPLDAYLATTADVPRTEFDSWPEPDRIAFLINVYNAATLRLVRDHYPVTSIRKIGGFFTSPWKIRTVRLWKGELTLDQLEHDILRKHYAEPRIHFALVCAARGCPPLREAAYVGTTLDADLEDQGRRFLAEPAKNRLDGEEGILWLSPIFQWYGDDFLKDGQVLGDVLQRWMKPQDAALFRTRTFKIRFTSYDWGLNDVARP